jgi:hypothetical protein
MSQIIEIDLENKCTPNPGETQDHFIGRCIGITLNNGTFSDSSQAAAYCHSQWRRSRRSVSSDPKKEVEMPEIIYKQMDCETELTKGKGGDEYFLATISTGDVDRDGDILDPKGLDLTNFNKTVLYRHNRTMGATAEETLPVGYSLWENVRGNKVKAAIQFHQKTKLSQLLYEFYKEKLMKDWSVGFMPIDSEPITDEKSGQITGRYIKKWALHEISSVPVGSNQFTDTQIVRMKEIQKELGISDESYLELFGETEKEPDENIEPENSEENENNGDVALMKSDITELKNEILILSKKLNDLIEIVTNSDKSKSAVITYPDDYLEFEGFGDSMDSSQELEQTEENEDEVVLELFDEEEIKQET